MCGQTGKPTLPGFVHTHSLLFGLVCVLLADCCQVMFISIILAVSCAVITRRMLGGTEHGHTPGTPGANDARNAQRPPQQTGEETGDQPRRRDDFRPMGSEARSYEHIQHPDPHMWRLGLHLKHWSFSEK